MTMNPTEQNPLKIIAFCCNWCAYAAADLAGIERLDYPEEIHIVRVMCSGMVHPDLVLESFHRGADGVMILGCRDGTCHYVDGNKKTKTRIELIEEILTDLGIESRRFHCEWLGSTESERFVAIARQMQKTITRLGPLSDDKR